MEVRFEDKKLQKLYDGQVRNSEFPNHVIENFRKWVWFAHSATEQKDFCGVLTQRFQRLAPESDNEQDRYQIFCPSSCRIILELAKDNNEAIAVFIRVEVIG
jgi:plasmid maintenance system killer protein